MSQRIYAMGFCQTRPYMEPSISPSTIMEAAFGRLHKSGAGWWMVEFIMVDGEIDGSIYGTIYPTVYGSKNGAGNKGVT